MEPRVKIHPTVLHQMIANFFQIMGSVAKVMSLDQASAMSGYRKLRAASVEVAESRRFAAGWARETIGDRNGVPTVSSRRRLHEQGPPGIA
jgi:hypothetical protein